MFKCKDFSSRVNAALAMRLLLIVAFAAVVVTASPRRMSLAQDNSVPKKQAAEDGGNTGPKKAAPDKSQPRPPIELAYHDFEDAGFWAVRPAVIFADAEMKPTAEAIEKFGNDWLHTRDVPQNVKLTLSDIEQVSGALKFKVDSKPRPGERGWLSQTVELLRTTKPYRWALLKPLVPDSTERVRHGMRVIEWSESSFSSLGLGKSTVLADDRTMLPFWTAERVDQWHGGATAKEAPSPGDAGLLECWRDVDQCMAASLYDNRKRQWKSLFGELGAAQEDWQFAAVGMDWHRDEVALRLVVECGSDAAAATLLKQIKEEIEEIGTESRAALPRDEVELKEYPYELQTAKSIIEFADNAKLQRDGRRVRVSTRGNPPKPILIEPIIGLTGAGLTGQPLPEFLFDLVMPEGPKER